MNMAWSPVVARRQPIQPVERSDPPGSLERSVADVSVIIPTYNRGDLLVRAVESVGRQTVQPREIIVVDDGSTDDTPARCAELGDRVLYVRIPNAGVAGARNAGIACARGEWIALLDSDDTWEPTKLEVQLAACRQQPAAGWSITGCELVDAADVPRGGPRSFAAVFPVFREFGFDPQELFAAHLARFDVEAAGATHICFAGDLFGLLLYGNMGLPSSALIRRQLLAEAGVFDASLRVAEETEFFRRVAAYSPVVVVMSPLVRYRWAQGDSLTSSANTERLIDAALRSLDAAAQRRALQPAEQAAWRAGRRALLLRLAYAQLSDRRGTEVRRTLRRLTADGLPWGRRGGALWAASVLPSGVLGALHRGKRMLRGVRQGMEKA
jgi:GT2 family glycosyltransferase